MRMPVGQRQLFLDDDDIAQMTNMTRSLHQPSKKGAVIRPNVERGESCLQIRCAPAWDPDAGVYKLWLMTSATHSGTTYAESEDGLHWRKPALRQREVNGSWENNVVTLDASLAWPANAIENVVYDPDDADASRRFKGLAHCCGREPIVSPDGIHWRKLDATPIPSADESNLHYDRQTRTFLATVKHGGPHGRSVYLSTSTDFTHWTEPALLFYADDLDQLLRRVQIARRFANPALQRPAFDIPAAYNVDVYNMGLFRNEGLYVDLPSLYHRAGQVSGDWLGFAEWDIPSEERDTYSRHGDWCGFHHVQVICSRDLRAWQRLGDRQPFLDLSPLGAWAYDLACIFGPSAPVVLGDTLWFYYTGIKQYGGPSPRREIARDQGAICLAVLRRDGFVSLDAGDAPGTVHTALFSAPGTRLFVNVDAPNGILMVEALDSAGKVVASSAPLTGDQPHSEVVWTQGCLTDVHDTPISLRMTLTNSRFYSYWFEE